MFHEYVIIFLSFCSTPNEKLLGRLVKEKVCGYFPLPSKAELLYAMNTTVIHMTLKCLSVVFSTV